RQSYIPDQRCSKIQTPLPGPATDWLRAHRIRSLRASYCCSILDGSTFVLQEHDGRPRADDIWRKATTANNDVYCRRVMQVMNEYIGIVVSSVLAGGITALMVLLSSTVGKKNPTPVKLAPFECGKEPFSLPVGRFAI